MGPRGKSKRAAATQVCWRLVNRDHFGLGANSKHFYPCYKRRRVYSKKVAAIATWEQWLTKCPQLLSLAFLYFSDVEYIDDIIVLDPKWLLKKYQLLILNLKIVKFKHLYICLNSMAFLAQPLCERVWKSDDVEYLPEGLLESLKTRHLAAKINAREVMDNYVGNTYFVPLVLPSRKEH